MSTALLVSVVSASLVGSLHCAGMCGGFIGFYAGADATSRARAWAHVAYNAGRLVTYVALGAVAGAAGAALDLAGKWAGVGRVAALAAGILMVGWGLVLLLESLGVGRLRPHLPSAVVARSVRVLSRLREKPPVLRAALMGLSSTLLPCGWLYAFVLTAAGAGSAEHGALVMAAFWSGTLPMLIGLGVLTSQLTRALRKHIPLISAAALILVGLTNLVSRVNAPALAASTLNAAFAAEHDAEHHPPTAELPPCHRKRAP